jgi:high-affinity Fe2+/Pb2+ permease
MKNLLKIASVLGLLLTVVPAFLVLNGRIAWDLHAQLMIAGMILWFASAPFWMKVDH